jgi:hypothetical protein
MNKTDLLFNWEKFLFIILVLAIVIFLIILIVIPVKMANKRGRSSIGWFIFCLVFSPFLAMLFLALLGETDEKRRERIIEEEKLKNKYSNPEIKKDDMENWRKQSSGKSINDYYSKK